LALAFTQPDTGAATAMMKYVIMLPEEYLVLMVPLSIIGTIWVARKRVTKWKALLLAASIIVSGPLIFYFQFAVIQKFFTIPKDNRALIIITLLMSSLVVATVQYFAISLTSYIFHIQHKKKDIASTLFFSCSLSPIIWSLIFASLEHTQEIAYIYIVLLMLMPIICFFSISSRGLTQKKVLLIIITIATTGLLTWPMGAGLVPRSVFRLFGFSVDNKWIFLIDLLTVLIANAAALYLIPALLGSIFSVRYEKLTLWLIALLGSFFGNFLCMYIFFSALVLLNIGC
jgi:hypothetical protein